MGFTAAKVYRAARLHAPELRKLSVDAASLVAAFNSALLELVLEVIDADPERLSERYELDPQVVAADPVDLTAEVVAGQVESGRREWLYIDYIDWLRGGEAGDEVTIITQEARHRGAWDHGCSVVGLLRDQLRRLEKVSGWDGVEGLAVWGVLRPQEVTEMGLDRTEFDYPAAMERALEWGLVAALASDLTDISSHRLDRWEARKREAYERAAVDARGFIGSRVEDIPYRTEF